MVAMTGGSVTDADAQQLAEIQTRHTEAERLTDEIAALEATYADEDRDSAITLRKLQRAQITRLYYVRDVGDLLGMVAQLQQAAGTPE